MAAIDRYLGREAQTKELFEKLDRDQPEVAREVFEIADRALVMHESFELANRYVDPPADLKRLVGRSLAATLRVAGRWWPEERLRMDERGWGRL